MNNRINRLCELAALKDTTTDKLRRFILEEDIEINGLHSKYKTRAIAFAAQSGSFENFVFLVEEMGAALDAHGRDINLLQWAHWKNADPRIRIYLTHNDKQLWQHFKDGTTELQMAVYSGDCPAVSTILRQEPDRIGELIDNKYSLLYWANLNNQEEMKTLLVPLYAAYHAKSAPLAIDSLENFHLQMRLLLNCSTHDEVNVLIKDIIILGRKLRHIGMMTESDHDSYLRKIFMHKYLIINPDDKLILPALDTSLTIESALAREKKDLHHILFTIKNSQIVLLTAMAMIKKDEMLTLLELRIEQAILCMKTIEQFKLIFNHEMMQESIDWERVNKCLNICYTYAEHGFLNFDELTQLENHQYYEMSISASKLLVDLNPIFKSEQKLAVESERLLQDQNPAIKITRSPIKSLFIFLQNKSVSPADVDAYLVDQTISATELYRQQTYIEHALRHSNVGVVAHLVNKQRSALASGSHPNNENLMHFIRKSGSKIPNDNREYILNQDNQLWTAFADGTTELHINAFAGRIELVLEALAKSPDRLMEVNQHGESVFYWASHSAAKATFEKTLKELSDNYILQLASVHDWMTLLAFYQSLKKYIHDCFNRNDRESVVTGILHFFKTLECDHSDDYFKINDYLHIMVLDYILSSEEQNIVKKQLEATEISNITNGIHSKDVRYQYFFKAYQIHVEAVFDMGEQAVKLSEEFAGDGNYLASHKYALEAQKNFSAVLKSCLDWPAKSTENFDNQIASIKLGLVKSENLLNLMNEFLGYMPESDSQELSYALSTVLSQQAKNILSDYDEKLSVEQIGLSLSRQSFFDEEKPSRPLSSQPLYPTSQPLSYQSISENKPSSIPAAGLAFFSALENISLRRESAKPDEKKAYDSDEELDEKTEKRRRFG